jgi:hypothetical protein
MQQTDSIFMGEMGKRGRRQKAGEYFSGSL